MVFIMLALTAAKRRYMSDSVRNSLDPSTLGSHQNIVQGAPILIRATDRKGRCVWFNKRWLEFTGDSSETALREGHWAGVHAEDRAETEAAFEAAFEQRDSLQLEYRLRKRDDSFCWVLDR